MDIEIDRASKTLYERHASALGLPNAKLFCRPPPQRGEYRLNEYLQNVSHQTGIVGQPLAQCIRQREHPLPDWNDWKHSIHEMRRCIGLSFKIDTD